VDQVLIRLHTFYPQARGAYTGYEIRRYSVDPSTGGSYLAFGPGQISKYWRLWEKPVLRVAFAGEHTDTLYPGTVEGALRSGQRAASQVQDLAAGKSFEPVKVAPPKAADAPKESNGNFFSNLFGGSSDKAEAKKPEPVKAADDSKAKEKGFFSCLFGCADEPVAKPVEKAPEPAPAPAPVPVVAPVVEPAKPEPAKAEPAKKAPAKHAEPAKKTPAQVEAAKKEAAKKEAAKKEAAKKEAAKKAAAKAKAEDAKN